MANDTIDPNAMLLAAALNEKTHNQAYGIFKDLNHELQENRKKGVTIQQHVEKAKALGFVIGAKVTRPGGGDVGEIVGYNESEFGFYNGYENPIKVKFPNTTDVYPYINYLVLVNSDENE